MTVRHVVVFRFHPGTPPQPIEELRAELAAFGPSLPEVRSYEVGVDLGVNSASWDFAVSATFDDTEHQRIIRELVEPIVVERASVQFAS